MYFMEPVRFICWLACINTLRLHGRRIDVSAEAGYLQDYDADEECVQTLGSVVGIAEVSFRWFSAMLSLSDAEQVQVRFWQSLLDEPLSESKAVIVDIHRAVALPVKEPLQEYSARVFRGLIVNLEEGQAERLWPQPAPHPPWFPWRPPTQALRMPLQFATSCVQSRWSAVVLPHLPRTRRQGTSSLSIGINVQIWVGSL